MITVYLIRHSIKEKNYLEIDTLDSPQLINEKIVLSKEGEVKALQLSEHEELKNLDEVWASNYVRAIATAKYICNKNNLKLNISQSFDERHYGTFNKHEDKKEFWTLQFKNKELKHEDGESLIDVQNRMDKKIREVIKEKDDKRIAIVCHNVCILSYLLKYCELESVKPNRKLTISYKGKTLIKDDIMKQPSIMKLKFDKNKLEDITYFY